MTKKKKRTDLLLEMEGCVYVVEKYEDNSVTKTPIDSDLVLRTLVAKIEEGLEGFEVLDKKELPAKK